ncbi:MAG: hypothetical protein AB7K71_10420 [Polyangiaceae bacterium]
MAKYRNATGQVHREGQAWEANRQAVHPERAEINRFVDLEPERATSYRQADRGPITLVSGSDGAFGSTDGAG